MKPLSKEAELNIMGAIEDVCAAVQEGLTPTAALAKVAAARQLGPHYIKLAAAGYNSGAVTYQREQGDSILSKLAEFPLVDPDAVIGELYPETIPPPAVEKAATDVSAEYRQPPRFRPRPAGGVEKAAYDRVAALLRPADAAPEVPPPSWSQKYADYAKQSQQLAEDRRQYAAAQDAFLGQLGQLGDYFRRSAYDVAYTPKEVQAALTARYGAAGRHLFDCLTHRTKLAVYGPAKLRPLDWEAEPLRLATTCLETARMLPRLKQACEQRAAQVEALHAELFPPARPAADPFAARPSILGKEAAPKAASFLGAVVGGGLARMATQAAPKPTGELAGDMLAKLDDPQQEDELRSIQARTLLQDLMMNDEVISGYDPEQVYGAYNEISQTMPRAATQPAIIRSILRKRLAQGSLEPFEAAEMANIERTLAQTQQQSQINPLAPKVAHVLGSGTCPVLVRR